MALIVPSGGLVSQVNGKVDDKVYYRGRWGNVVRAWVNPANTITPERTAARALFASEMSLYNSLTPDMQDEWNKFASYQVKFNRLAQPYVPTGLQVFLERNINLDTTGNLPLLLPPIDGKILPIQSITAGTFTTTSMPVAVSMYDNLSVLPLPFFGCIYATNNQPPGRNFMSNRYRFLFARHPGFTMNIDWYGAWHSIWNLSIAIPGKKVFFKAVIINGSTGQASAPAFCSQIIS
jgi:hypothetical protein